MDEDDPFAEDLSEFYADDRRPKKFSRLDLDVAAAVQAAEFDVAVAAEQSADARETGEAPPR